MRNLTTRCITTHSRHTLHSRRGLWMRIVQAAKLLDGENQSRQYTLPGQTAATALAAARARRLTHSDGLAMWPARFTPPSRPRICEWSVMNLHLQWIIVLVKIPSWNCDHKPVIIPRLYFHTDAHFGKWIAATLYVWEFTRQTHSGERAPGWSWPFYTQIGQNRPDILGNIWLAKAFSGKHLKEKCWS